MKLRFLAKADKSAGKLHIYDVIGADPWFGGGISAKSVVDALTSLKDCKTLDVHISSEGGSVFEGVAIHSALRQFSQERPGTTAVTVHIDSLAASIASIIAMAGDRILMAQNALIMIHEASDLAFGTAEKLRETAALVEKINGVMAETYAARTKQPVEKCAAMMAATTWFTAAEAKAAGFVDEITAAVETATAAAHSRLLAQFKGTPSHAAALLRFVPTAVVEPTPTPSPKETSPMKILLAALMLSETATEAEAVAVVNKMREGEREIGRELTVLTGKSSTAEALGVLQAHKQAASKVAGLEAELARVAAAQLEQERAGLIAQANKDGKLPPGMNAWAQGAELATLKAYLAAATPVVQLVAVPQGAPAAATALTDTEKKIAKSSNISEADFAAEKKRLAERDAARRS